MEVNMNKFSQVRYISIIIIMALCMAVSMAMGFVTSNENIRSGTEKESRMIAALVCNAIDNNFLRPLTVSETMSKDSVLRDYLKKSGESAQSVEADIADYLDSMRTGFGYCMVFAVSDKSHAYYTYNGISKIIDPENDPHDIWYKLFLESGKSTDLDVDTDEAANWALSVFVNDAIYDENNEFLGVCGVGVEMTQLQQYLAQYERIYNVDIDLIDKNGLMQVSTDGEEIKRDYIAIDNLSKYADGEYYYEIIDDGNRVITYMENLDWFLVVTDSSDKSIQTANVSNRFFICMAVAAVLILVIVLMTFYYETVQAKNSQDEDD